MQSVSSISHHASVSHVRTQIAGRATTDAIPDIANVEPADLRSRLQGGEALQERAESGGVETDEASANGPGTSPMAADPGLRVGVGVGSIFAIPAPTTITGLESASSSNGPTARDATRSIENLAATMAVDTAVVRQSIDDGSLNQLLAQNGVQSSLGMLFNTRL